MNLVPRGGAVLLLAFAGNACGRSSDSATIVAAGHVEATEVRLAAKIPGRIESYSPREGDRLQAGQEVARIDTTDLRLAREQTKAERALADAELRLRLAGARKEEIAELEAQVAAARADLAGAQTDWKRARDLADRGSGTGKALDDATTRRDVSASRLAAAEQVLERARAGSRAEEIEAARARVAAADARIALLDQQIRDGVVTSPATGILTAKAAERGELLGAGAPLGVVTDMTDAWLTVWVGEPDLGRIRIGDVVEVVTDDGRRREGKLSFVASQAEFTPRNAQTREERVKLVFKVKIALDNGDGLFKPGMPAEARFDVSRRNR